MRAGERFPRWEKNKMLASKLLEDFFRNRMGGTELKLDREAGNAYFVYAGSFGARPLKFFLGFISTR